MRAFVTGGAGFIGSHIVDRLVSEGHKVSVIDNLSTGKSENLNSAAEFYKLDIENPRIEKVIRKEKPEVICHLAAQMDVRRSVADPAFDAKTNIIGMINLLEYAVRHGQRQDPFGEAGVVAIFTKKMLKNDQPLINGNGMQTRDYVYVEDVVNAVMLAMENNANDIFNVGTGIETSVNDLFRLLSELTGSNVREMHGAAKKGEQMRSCLSYDKIKKTMEWEPSIPLRTGLANTVEFFRGRQ